MYNFNVNTISSFSFYLPKQGYASYNYMPSKLAITTTGNLFALNKKADTKSLEEKLKSRKK